MPFVNLTCSVEVGEFVLGKPLGRTLRYVICAIVADFSPLDARERRHPGVLLRNKLATALLHCIRLRYPPCYGSAEPSAPLTD